MWYSDLLSDTGLLSSYVNVSKDLIIARQSKKNDKNIYEYRAFRNLAQFWNFYLGEPDYAKTFNEVTLASRIQKLRFDLDLEGISDKKIGSKLLNYVIGGTLEYFKTLNVNLDLEKDFIIFTSHGSEKLSYHIIIDNYAFKGSKVAKFVAGQIAKDIPKKYKKWIDLGVCDANHPLRIYGSHKWGNSRVKIWNQSFRYTGKIYKTKLEIDETDDEMDINIIEDYAILRAGLITCTGHCKVLDVETKTYDVSNIEVTEEHVQEALKLLENLDYGDAFDYYKSSGNFINLIRRRPSECYCGGYHESQNPYLLITDSGIYFCCRRSPNGEKLKLGEIELNNVAEKVKEPVYSSYIEIKQRLAKLSGRTL